MGKYLEQDVRENWKTPDQCPMYKREADMCISVAKPYRFCSFCQANDNRWQSKPKPKKITIQVCYDCNLDNRDCRACLKKKTGGNKGCNKNTIRPRYISLALRRRKKRGKDKLIRQGTEWTIERREETRQRIEELKKERD